MVQTGQVETVWREIRFALRGLRASPAFTLTAVVILAIGIGGNTAVFTIVRAVLLKPLAYPSADELVYLSLDNVLQNERDQQMSIRRYRETRERAGSFADVGAFLKWPEEMVLSGRGAPEALQGARVSANYLDILGTKPVLGRGFQEEEDAPAGRSVVMISESLWNRRFSSDPEVIGDVAVIDTIPHTIVGMLPAGFAFPFPETEVWVTRPSHTSAFPARFWEFVSTLVAFGRVAPGVTLEQARSELEILNEGYVANYPKRQDGRPGTEVRVRPLIERTVSDARPLLWFLFGSVGLVLLVASANIAGLMLTRAASHSREHALRSALGASGRRLAGSLFVEGALVAIAGGAVGVAIAMTAVAFLPRLSMLELPRVAEAEVDGFILAFNAVICVATGIGIGLFPALGISRRMAHTGLAGHGSLAAQTSSTQARHLVRIQAQDLLVVVQIALSVALLVGAVALVQGLQRLLNVEFGCETQNLLTMKLSLPPKRYDTAERRAAFHAELERRVSASPSVSRAALMRSIPTVPTIDTNVSVVGRPHVPVEEQLMARLQSVTSDYFDAMRIPILRGRAFALSDDSRDSPPKIIVNEALARHFWPAYPTGENPVGQYMAEGLDRIAAAEIVGIVGDVREVGHDESPGPAFYVPMALHAPQVAYLVARPSSGAQAAVSTITDAVLAIDGGQPVSDVRMMDAVLDAKLGQRRIAMQLVVGFALTALLLAIVGIYGTMAHWVVLRTPDLGIRRALGARQLDVVRLVLVRVLKLTSTGIVIGIGAALALGSTMQTFVFHVRPTDPTTISGVALLTLAAALVAIVLPAWRAGRIDPLDALRGD